MKTIQLLIAATALFLSTAMAQSRLELNLILDKTQFGEVEPIPLGVELMNVSGVSVSVREPINRVGCSYRLFREDGAEVPYSGGEYFHGEWPMVTIGAGKSVLVIEEIEQLFGNYISLATAHKTLKKGRYTLLAQYWSGGESSDTAGAVTTFDVVEPMGEEKKAYETFMRTMWEARGGGDIKTPEELIRRLEEFEATFPASVYTPIVLVEIAAKYKNRLGQREKAWEVGMRLVRNFPDAVVGRGYLEMAVGRMKTNEEGRTFLRELAQKAKTPLGKRSLRDFAKKQGLE